MIPLCLGAAKRSWLLRRKEQRKVRKKNRLKTHVGFVNEVIPPHIATSDNALHLRALCPSPVQ